MGKAPKKKETASTTAPTSGNAYNMYNVQEAEFWKQRVDRENAFASKRPAPPSEVGSMATTNLSRASSTTRTKIENLEHMLMEERLKRQELERKLQTLLENSAK